jgi:hypothetical protein
MREAGARGVLRLQSWQRLRPGGADGADDRLTWTVFPHSAQVPCPARSGLHRL